MSGRTCRSPDEIDELPYLNQEQLAEAFDMVARLNKGEAIGSSPLADLVNHVHTKNKVPANYFQMTPAQQQRWARRSYRQTARAWWRRSQPQSARTSGQPIRCPSQPRPRRMWKRGFRLARGDPDPHTAPPTPWLEPGGRTSVSSSEKTGLSEGRKHCTDEFNSAPEFFHPIFFGNRESRPDRARRLLLAGLAADYFEREIAWLEDRSPDDCTEIWRDAARSRR